MLCNMTRNAQTPDHSDLTQNTVLRLSTSFMGCGTATGWKKRKIRRTFWGALLPVRLHRDVRVQVVQRAVGLFAPLPAAFVHPLDLFVSSARALVLLGARDGHKRVDLRGGGQDPGHGGGRGRQGHRGTYLTSAGSCGRACSAGRDARARGAVGSGEVLRVPGVLLRIVVAGLRLARGIVAHVMAPMAVGRVLRIGRAGLRDGGIYRYVRVRFHVRRVMMVIRSVAIV